MRILIKSGFVLVALLFCFGYVYQSPRATNRAKQNQEALPSLADEEFARAKVLFKEKCARCHGTNGRGKTTLGNMLRPPDFTNKRWWKDDIDDQRLMKSIANGKSEMPAFGKKLTRQEIVSLVAYVRRFKSPK